MSHNNTFRNTTTPLSLFVAIKSVFERVAKDIFEVKSSLYNYVKRIYNHIMPPRENQQAIVNWQNWLNRTYPPGPWMPINGFTAIITTIPGVNRTATYNPSEGYPLKSFVNSSTGEVKSFDARRFYA